MPPSLIFAFCLLQFAFCLSVLNGPSRSPSEHGILQIKAKFVSLPAAALPGQLTLPKALALPHGLQSADPSPRKAKPFSPLNTRLQPLRPPCYPIPTMTTRILPLFLLLMTLLPAQ